MNTKNISCHESSYGSLNGSSFEFPSPSCDKTNLKQLWCTEVPLQPLLSDYSPWKNNLSSSDVFDSSENGSGMPPCHSSGDFPKCVESIPASFYAAGCLISSSPQSFHAQSYASDFSLPVAPKSQFSLKGDKRIDVSSSWETFESEDKFPLHVYGISAVTDKRQKLLLGRHQDAQHISAAQSTEEGFNANSSKRRLICLEAANKSSVGCKQAKCLMNSPSFQLQNEKKQTEDSIIAHVTSNNHNSAISIPSKTRIRWTPDLHEQFVECVNCLGGAEKATPKGILKLMDSDGITIYHIKSHLQKYRMAKYMPKSSEGKVDMKASANDLQHGMQISEALRIQLEVQRHLHEQLEIQRNLQIRIEAQSRQLQQMFSEQIKSKKNPIESQDLVDIFPAERQETPQGTQILSIQKDYQNSHFQ